MLLAGALCQAKLATARAADPFPAYATDACSANPWLIPFDPGQAELSDVAQGRLDALVAAWHVDAGPLLASGRVDGAEDGRYPGLSQPAVAGRPRRPGEARRAIGRHLDEG